MSLDALAWRVGTTNQQVSHLELGKRRLTATWFLRLADALACDPLELPGIARDPLLVERERSLLIMFRLLPADQQDALLAVVRTIMPPAATDLRPMT